MDEQGRIFGRFNLIDLALGVILVGLIPISYGAYVLFRTPLPRVTGVEPATLQAAPSVRVTIRGEHLRPYMRVSFNDYQGRNFLFENPSTAQVDVVDLPPGEYDVVLYDYAQERGRIPKALTITPSAVPASKVDLAGFLTGVTEGEPRQLTPGLALPGLGEVTAVGAPRPDFARVKTGERWIEIPVPGTLRIPMVVRIACHVAADQAGTAHCVQGPALGPNVYILLPTPAGNRPFVINEVRPPESPTSIEIGVRLTGEPAARALVKTGDVDVGVAENELAAGARVTSVADGGQARLSVPAFRSLSGWMYAGQALKVGAPFVFQTTRYQAEGVITAVPPLAPEPAAK